MRSDDVRERCGARNRENREIPEESKVKKGKEKVVDRIVKTVEMVKMQEHQIKSRDGGNKGGWAVVRYTPYGGTGYFAERRQTYTRAFRMLDLDGANGHEIGRA